MNAERVIGRWAMTALVINTIVGSGIFGIPSELTRLLGSASPWAMVAAAAAMSIIALAITEVASQFSEPGGLYLYARVAFGPFIGLQVGWFWILAVVGGGAAGAHLFLSYLGTFLPIVNKGALHAAALLLLIAIPTGANYIGVRSGVVLSTLLTIAKLIPIVLLTVLGLFWHGSAAQTAISGQHHSWSAWLTALLLLMFSYSGYEDALVPMGEVHNPRRTVPMALGLGILACAVLYTGLQFAVVHVVGLKPTEKPVADLAMVLLGRGGQAFVAGAVMLSTYGWLSAGFLSAPRLLLSFARNGDAPAALGRLHPRYATPTMGILLYGAAVSLLAITGTFLWILAVTAGSAVVLYASGCAALIRLRAIRPQADSFRVPAGPVFAVAGVIIAIALLTQLQPKQVALMSLASLTGAANWAWARGPGKWSEASVTAGVGD